MVGKKTSYKCPNSGKLIKDVLRITKYHLPKIFNFRKTYCR
ncbi:MAG: hypothetical protein OXJ52_06305 [Oligoflexia bacterium]|nr:hypothetical protein [Oligoflexia bacterium]